MLSSINLSRAFADGNGDGWGDFGGLLEHLDYLEWLGVDCVWLTPFFPSPLKDDGYDISSFYEINPQYGTLEELRLVVDRSSSTGDEGHSRPGDEPYL